MTPETFTAAKILELAFGAIIKTGVGKLTEGAIAKGKELWQKIKQRFQGEPAIEAALLEVETNQSKEVLLQQVVPFLQVEMLKDKQFAQEIQQLAQQIVNINQSTNQNQTQIDTQINKDIKQQFNIQNNEGGINVNLDPE